MSARSHRFEFQFTVPGSHPALPGHFPGRPIVPGALVLDNVLTGVTAEMDRPVSVLQNVKFAGILLPDEIATVACEATGDTVRFSVSATHAQAWVTLASGNLQLAVRTNVAVNSDDMQAGGSQPG